MIELPHKVLGYSCPINGLEDLYEWKTGVRLPGYCLMDLATIGFTYIKQKNAPAPRMVFWGNGMGKPLFNFLADVIGFEWSFTENKSFRSAWQSAQNSLESGLPVILGQLDMYHLPYYPKFYHKIHIPQHYVLLVGTDEERKTALVQDNGLAGIQSIPHEDLQEAWNVRVPGQGKPNTHYTLRLNQRPADLETIWRRALKKRARLFLEPPVGFLGVRGMKKAQKEISGWVDELEPYAWEESLRSLATFTCSVVPNLPQTLMPYPLGYEDPHHACRDRFAKELAAAAETYHENTWVQAAALFQKSGLQIGRLTELACMALSGKPEVFRDASEIMKQIITFEEEAFQLLV